MLVVVRWIFFFLGYPLTATTTTMCVMRDGRGRASLDGSGLEVRGVVVVVVGKMKRIEGRTQVSDTQGRSGLPRETLETMGWRERPLLIIFCPVCAMSPKAPTLILWRRVLLSLSFGAPHCEPNVTNQRLAFALFISFARSLTLPHPVRPPPGPPRHAGFLHVPVLLSDPCLLLAPACNSCSASRAPFLMLPPPPQIPPSRCCQAEH